MQSFRSIFCAPFALFAVFAFVTCGDWVRNQRQEKFLRNLAQLKSYAGQAREEVRGNQKLNYRLAFQRPNRFHSEILSKGPYHGARTAYDGSTFAVYYPWALFGYEFRNFQPVDAETEDRRRRLLYDRELKEYQVSLEANREVAGFTAAAVRYDPIRESPLRFTAHVWFAEDFSFPLRTELNGKDGQGPLYSLEFSRIEFNRAIPDKTFRIAFPAGADVVRWDFKSANYSPARVRAEANFPLRLPRAGLEEFTLRRGVSAPGLVPAYAFLYKRDPFFVLLSMYKDYGIAPVRPGHGIPIQIEKRVLYLSFLGMYPAVYFKYGGVIYHFVSSLPYPDLLAIAAGLL